MSEIPKAYEPQSVEDKWYAFWQQHGCFTADPARVSKQRPAYSIVIPPPNVTGMLHMGHVLNNTIQDILARKARMDGKEVLWLPGTDHAGIATQVQVEKALKKEERLTKHDLGREKFLERVWQWKEKHGGIIIQQLKKLGCSCDWTRERFTMDPEYSLCVQKVFVELYKKGLIYRGKRMVNWCPASLTALSDEEVEMESQRGFLYYFKVEVVELVGQASSPAKVSPGVSPGGEGADARTTNAGGDAYATTGTFLTIATTRPETIPGDTAIAVNPKDPRYAHLIGKHALRPLPCELPREQKLIPIIGDEYVDFEFGTGVLKVTPAHDKNDFAIGQRHKLAAVDIMNPNGSMNDLAGKDMAGMDRFAARKVAVEKLKELGALEKEEPYENKIGFSQRARVPIEPRLSEQWFLKYPAVEESKAYVANSRRVRVVVLRGDELAGANRSELRRSALQLARAKGWLGQSFLNQETGWKIHVRRRSLSHAFSSRDAAAIQAMAALPELIQSALLIRSEPHDPPAPDFKAVHHFLAALRIGDQDFGIPITVKELLNGQYLYDHQAKKITPGGKPLGPHPLAEKLGIQPAPGAEWKLADLLAAVNLRKAPGMEFYPQRWAKVYDHWLTNLQDWCISRQLWWGHRIPVWYNARWQAAGPKTVKIVHQDWNTISGINTKDMRENAWRYAREHGFINSDFPNLDAGFDITVQQSSLEHGFANRGLANIKLIPALPSLLRHAVRVATVPHVPPAREVLCVHVFCAALQLGRTLFRVKFTVKEFRSRLRLYDHQTVEMKKMEADGKYPPEEASVEGSFAPWPASVSEMSMAELIGSVNPEFASLRCQIESPGEGWEQDPDVLDTWFSSWLWPFATMGWTGDKSQDSKNPTLQAFYPTTDLVTGPDIIFFWVARMIMAGYEFMGDLPFRNVYFTGIIRDKQGRKMSKTLGNSPDPLELIAKYGADALRFGTMRSAPLGQDVLFDEKDVELGRNFCNKLWNACRFRQMVGGKDEGRMMNDEKAPPAGDSSFNLHTSSFPVQGEINPSLLTSDDKWILLKLNDAIREISEAFAEYKFNEATATLYRFFWSEYCDWYVEASKAVLSRPPSDASPSPLGGERAGVRGEDGAARNITAPPHPDPLPPAPQGGEGEAASAPQDAHRANTLAVIDFVLSHTLRLFHPFLPFITEELWHGMGYAQDMPENQGGQTIMNAPWPKPFEGDFRDHYGLDDCALEFANQKYEVVTQGRNLRRIGNIQSGKKVKFVLKPNREMLPHDVEVIKILLNAEALAISESYAAQKGTPTAHTPMGELLLPLEGHVDPAAEIARLTKEKEKIQAEIGKVEQKLANPAFAQKVPATVLAEHQQRLTDWQAKLAHVMEALKAFEG